MRINEILKMLISNVEEINEGQAKLYEKEDGNSYSVTIKNIPKKSLLIPVDDHFHLKKIDFFNTSKSFDQTFGKSIGYACRSDYILFTPSEDEKHQVLFIELKRKRESQYNNKIHREIFDQLAGSECLWEYCCQLTAQFWNCHTLLNAPKNLRKKICLAVPPRGQKRGSGFSEKNKTIHKINWNFQDQSLRGKLKRLRGKTFFYNQLIR